MIDISQFKEKCNKGFCSRQTMKSKQCLKESKQELCYDKWKAKLNHIAEKRVIKDDEDIEWKMLKEEIKIRDNFECRFYQVATKEERKVIDEILMNNPRLAVLDGAHVVARSKCKKMIYDNDNVYLLSRYVHGCIDGFIDPITKQSMSWEESQNYWIRIIGQEKYNELYERYNKTQEDIRNGK
jgi:hypothetical protein